MTPIADDCPPYDPNDDDYPDGWLESQHKPRHVIRSKRFWDVVLFLFLAAASYGAFKWFSIADLHT